MALVDVIDGIERAICARYNVRSLADLPHFLGAATAARNGDLAPLEEMLRGREMYHWRAEIDAGLEAARAILLDEQAPTAEEDAPAAPAPATEGVTDDATEEPEATADEDAPETTPKRSRR